MESLLSSGYSSVHMRLGLDTEMFTPKSAEYMKQKDDIIEQLKKRLNQLLYDLFKQEDFNSCNKPIYNLRLHGETEVKKRSVF